MSALAMYHITREKYLDSIMKLGLKASYNNGLARGGKFDVVFLTNNLLRIINTQIGTELYRERDYVILSIDTNGLEVRPWLYKMTGLYSDFEFVIPYVPPSLIVVNDFA